MPRAHVVVDLGYGDAGKGSIVDFLTKHYQVGTVVRFNGGPQAAHNVVLPDGTWHTFSQWGSGTLQGARTFLSRYMLVNPLNAENEAIHLETIGVPNPFELLSVDALCPVITPWHVADNRIRETFRGSNRHGSCGEGIGSVMQDYLDGRDFLRIGEFREGTLAKSLMAVRDRIAEKLISDVGPFATSSHHWPRGYALVDADDAYRAFAAKVEIVDDWKPKGDLIFEGAQGVLIDETFGTAPYNTWSKCTLENALALLQGYDGEITKLGATRTYMVRHGPGPFPTETNLDVLEDVHNGTGEWQGPMRYGYLDLFALRYAYACAGPIDGLAVTHMDHGIPGNRWCVGGGQDEGLVYEESKDPDVTGIFEEGLGLPIIVFSWGPTWHHKLALRSNLTGVSVPQAHSPSSGDSQ